MDSNSRDAVKGIAISNIDRGMRSVGPAIDKLTSASLKRVLKTITHVHVAEQLLTGKSDQLNEAEQSLIDKIFALQEDVLGYTQLQNEINSEEQEKTHE